MSVRDWALGSQVWGELVAVRDVQLRTAGSNRPQTSFTVFDASGTRTATSWDLPASQVDAIVAAGQVTPPLLRVSGMVDTSEKYAGQLKITGVTPVPPDEAEATDPREFLDALPLDHEQLVTGLDRLIGRVRDPHFAALLAKTIGRSGCLRASFVGASAAKKNHHAYPGGLLRHSLEVTELALHATGRFSGLHKDLLVTAGLLHDIGKVFEMDHEWQRGTYTDAGNLLGHIVLGTERIGAVCRGLKFPEPLRHALLHAMVAHHDEQQFGSPVCPKTAEAITIAKCDQISAELDAFFQAHKDAPPHQRTVFQNSRAFFLGDLGLGAQEADASIERPEWEDPEDCLLRRLDQKDLAFHGFGISRLPILGAVAAGDGIRSSAVEAEPDTRETAIPADGADFLLRVTGDSMTAAGILPDDLLVVRAQETARIGQIVVAHIPGVGVVVKRLTETREGRFLASENPIYEPIPVGDDVRIQGIVVRVERDFE